MSENGSFLLTAMRALLVRGFNPYVYGSAHSMCCMARFTMSAVPQQYCAPACSCNAASDLAWLAARPADVAAACTLIASNVTNACK